MTEDLDSEDGVHVHVVIIHVRSTDEFNKMRAVKVDVAEAINKTAEQLIFQHAAVVDFEIETQTIRVKLLGEEAFDIDAVDRAIKGLFFETYGVGAISSE